MELEKAYAGLLETCILPFHGLQYDPSLVVFANPQLNGIGQRTR